MSGLRGETHGNTRRCVARFRYVCRPIHLRLLPDAMGWSWRRTRVLLDLLRGAKVRHRKGLFVGRLLL